MKRLLATDDVHPRDRFDYWHRIACKSLIEHDAEAENSADFRATIDAAMLDDLGLVLCDNSPIARKRTPRHAAHSGDDDLLICQMLAGTAVLEQLGHEIVLRPGEFALLDPMLPFGTKVFQASRSMTLKIPRREIEARVGKTREMVAVPLGRERPESGMASSFLRMLPAYAGRMSSVAEKFARNQSIDLIALSLAATAEGGRPSLSSSRSLVFSKLRAVVDAGLADPALDAGTVAARAGVSVRYANSVLADAETSIMRLVQTRRLFRCRTALTDPSQAHRSVSEIAYGWGFSDMTHFGRKFKKAYGMSPTEYRRLCRTSHCEGSGT